MALPAFAAVLPSMLAALEKWSEWGRIRGAPDRVDSLEARIAALEDAASKRPGLAAPQGTRAPGNACPACGAYAMRRTEVCLDLTRPEVPNARLETWTCSECGSVDEVESPPRR